MEQPTTPSAGGHLLWLILGWRRIGAAVVAGALAFVLTRGLPQMLVLYGLIGVLFYFLSSPT
jgi:hypothetical protein